MTPFIPEFPVSVLLSYRHLDNQADWITRLHAYMERRLTELLGIEKGLWRDPQLHGGDSLWGTIEPHLSRTAVFIPILSPSYFQSPACLYEFETFRKSAASNGGLFVENTSRIIRVVKTPYDRHAEPPFFKKDEECIEFRFYEEIPQSGARMREYPAGESIELHGDFVNQAEVLVQSVCGVLQKMKRTRTTTPKPSRKKIFLAETTADRVPDRAFLAAELGLTCDIAPTAALPNTVEELSARLAAELTGSALSVHLLGSRFGVLPEGEEVRSVPQIQFEHAASVRRLVWIPEDMPQPEPRQQRFLEQIEAESCDNVEPVRSGRQAFVQHVKDVMEELARPPKEQILGKAVYLVSDESDLVSPHLREIRNCLLHHGFRVEFPAFDGDIAELRAMEEQNLRETNAALIYYGTAKDRWIKTRRSDILKVLSTLELSANYQRALYLCSPRTPPKVGNYMGLPNNRLQEPGAPPLLILGDCSDYTCDELSPLLAALAGQPA